MQLDDTITAALASVVSDSDADKAQTAENLAAFRTDDNTSMMGGWT
ncbi:hypothetical protein [Actinomadura hibisca]|nr:hypothetical protein [Actinomadura hibisca]